MYINAETHNNNNKIIIIIIIIIIRDSETVNRK
jgi:hypothetical protein